MTTPASIVAAIARAVAPRPPERIEIRGLELLHRPRHIIKIGGRTLGYGYRLGGTDRWENDR